MAPEARANRADRSSARRLTAEDVAARVLLDAASFDEAIPRILEAICRTLDWEHGALWTIDAEANALRCTEIWTDPQVTLSEFHAISRRITFQKGAGLPGRVWASGEPAWIPDVVLDPNFPRAAIAAREGLHGAFGFPLHLRDEIFGVMEFFSREIREPNDELLGMLTTVGHEIGMFIERRRAQDELDRFFRLSLDPLCVAGFDGYFKRVNPAWGRVLGYTERELLTRPYMDLVHPDDRAATVAAAGRLTEGEEVIYFENRYFHRDGTIRWLLWAATPYQAERVVYAAARDITDRKASEEALSLYARDLEVAHGQVEEQASRLSQLVRELDVARQHAEQAAETKSAFLANMSHEIRTPLNAILGMTRLALGTRLSVEQHDYLSIVRSSAESLLDIINDVLDFSRIEARRLELDRTPFALRDTVGDAARLLALKAAEKGLELACDIAAEVPDALIGDPGRLRQILINVIGNAVKFTTEGEVVLRVAVEHRTRDLVTLRFSVRDTGIGIPTDKLTDVFDAFTQADSSTTRRYGGTGLGLAIARRLVDLMSGRIWVESEVGRGSTFHFTAAFHGLADTERPGVPESAVIDGLRVLVVDDNATSRRILQQMLASWRLKASAVATASSALTVLRRAAATPDRFDLVVADGDMPRLTGFSLAERIRGDQRLAQLPIVLLTSVARPDNASRAAAAGVNACVSKPVKHSDLLEALDAMAGGVMRRSSARPPSAAPPTPLRSLRVLVAEDNAVSRKLVTTLLEKRGHHVESVVNGREAIAAVTGKGRKAFDIVLMDVQMPEVGGLEATEAIRGRERRSGRRVPIIALTAHAMPGDRQRCLDAGMDGYLTKPLDADELIDAVEHIGVGPSAAKSVQADQAPRLAIFDQATALSQAAGDRTLLTEVIALFRSERAVALRQIKRAIDKQDGEALRMAAHKLKSSTGAVGSPATGQTALLLEQLGRDQRFAAAVKMYLRLSAEMQALETAFVAAGFGPPERRTRRPSRQGSRTRGRR
ncbi:MAG: response regulator [Acidobacteriota bacterium]